MPDSLNRFIVIGSEKMAPSPEDDNAPKAPDKSDKNKCDKVVPDENVKEKDKEEKVSFVYFFGMCHTVKSLIKLLTFLRIRKLFLVFLLKQS